jgi:pimeloyl-ACP methyl ester carboxylesterase
VVIGASRLHGALLVPKRAAGLVLFTCASGARCPRLRYVATCLARGGLASLRFDLLTPEEMRRGHRMFDMTLLTNRAVEAIAFSGSDEATANLPMALFGISTGAGAALVAAARHPGAIAAVVSLNGRPDLAGLALPHVLAPTLLVVGFRDQELLAFNRFAQGRLSSEASLVMTGSDGKASRRGRRLISTAHLCRTWLACVLSGAAADPLHAGAAASRRTMADNAAVTSAAQSSR